MNRLVLIGNGFDLAHGLHTSYSQFIDNMWKKIIDKLLINCRYDDQFFTFTIKGISGDILCANQLRSNSFDNISIKDYVSFQKWIKDYETSFQIEYKIKNRFFNHLTNKIGKLENWVDIEEEYYKFLKYPVIENGDQAYKYPGGVTQLNEDFKQIKQALNEYLGSLLRTKIKKDTTIDKIIKSDFGDHDFALNTEFQTDKIDKEKAPESTVILNFNYTPLETCYLPDDSDVIHIHGKVNDSKNPMIFGYGDEMDSDYSEIEKLNDNEYLENIKSIRYFHTDNYKRLLGFMNMDYYQVVILGHSCGNADRTLLSTLFNHPKCISIKPYYHEIIKKNDSTGEKTHEDNYIDIIQNISRHFSNKSVMRDKVVSKIYCSPFSTTIL
ncbi:AbiH family protein [Microbacter margulisiae]|uniref:Bacteriophage abortive infection AbiH n=1 Tax=Microbacter margulisiae TaxID=1350067 RepID=A0A7W5DU43_9PORP|nr:AbiH family protein [Microbacter margulisiae]MBB3188745.1 hypothetical protein [Microbacter margulisiae]